MPGLETASVARQVVRALRGRRSQVWLSRRLGYRSNVVYRWEAGLRAPSAAEVLRLALRVGVDVEAALRTFDPTLADEAAALGSVGDEVHLRGWLAALRRGRRLAEVAQRAGLSTPVVQRLFAGRTTASFEVVLALVDALEDRLVDFVGALVPLAAVPALGPRLLALAAQREQSFRLRWTEAVLAALEVHGADPAPQVEGIAARLSLGEPLVREILDALVATGGLQRRAGRWAVPAERRVDTTVDRARHQTQARFWAEAALGVEGPAAARGYLVLSCAEADLAALFELHRRVHADTVELVARSPAERVLVVSIQTVALDGRPLPSRRRG